MSGEQIPLIDVTPFRAERKPPREDMFLVVAYSHSRGWSCRRLTRQDEHATLESAERQAHNLAAEWTSRCIARLPLGGE